MKKTTYLTALLKVANSVNMNEIVSRLANNLSQVYVNTSQYKRKEDHKTAIILPELPWCYDALESLYR